MKNLLTSLIAAGLLLSTQAAHATPFLESTGGDAGPLASGSPRNITPPNTEVDGQLGPGDYLDAYRFHFGGGSLTVSVGGDGFYADAYIFDDGTGALEAGGYIAGSSSTSSLASGTITLGAGDYLIAIDFSGANLDNSPADLNALVSDIVANAAGFSDPELFESQTGYLSPRDYVVLFSDPVGYAGSGGGSGSEVPVPATLYLMGLGLAGLGFNKRRGLGLALA